MSFEPNRGQTDARVSFLARGGGYSLFLEPTRAVFALDARGRSRRRGDSSRVMGEIVLPPLAVTSRRGGATHSLAVVPHGVRRGRPALRRARGAARHSGARDYVRQTEE